MIIGLLRLIFVNLLLVLPAAFAGTSEAQETSDLSDDSHFREELGINQYTTPSIGKLFDTLDSLKPIPARELSRPPRALRLDNRIRFALGFGILIGDGFLAVVGEDAKAIAPLGRELLRRAKGLGVQQPVNRHSKQLLDLAKQSDWNGLRKELIVTQKDVETAMLELRDEEMAHLLSLGGWIRGLEIGAASVATDFSPERASQLRQLDLLDYYLQRLDTFSPPLKSTPLISKITCGTKRRSPETGCGSTALPRQTFPRSGIPPTTWSRSSRKTPRPPPSAKRSPWLAARCSLRLDFPIENLEFKLHFLLVF